jgi:hypothetical protein
MVDNSWRALYENAILELDPDKFQICAEAAEQAISASVASLNGEISRGERMDMIDALSTLRVLTRDWERKTANTRKRHKTS